MSSRKRNASLNIHDPRLPQDVSITLSRLMQLGYSKADIPYFVETRMLEANHLTLTDLRSVLRARQAARTDASGGSSAGRQIPILNAVGQDRTHTMFCLRVNLTS